MGPSKEAAAPEVVYAQTWSGTCCPPSLPGNLAADVAAPSRLWSGFPPRPPPHGVQPHQISVSAPTASSGAQLCPPLRLPLEFRPRGSGWEQNAPAARRPPRTARARSRRWATPRLAPGRAPWRPAARSPPRARPGSWAQRARRGPAGLARPRSPRSLGSTASRPAGQQRIPRRSPGRPQPREGTWLAG